MEIIKEHVHAAKSDILISSSSGMTGVINKFQRILGLRIHERFAKQIHLSEEDTPIIFCTHMEHHSNQTTWLETVADVEVIHPDEYGLVDLTHLAQLLLQYAHRKVKIAAITSCSNVTGIFTPYHEIAQMMHGVGGLCFVDFACSAPYIDIDMHPADPDAYLDAIYFSPHKFLGGPGSAGALIFNKKLYHNAVPDHPGGGTVVWTDPWGFHQYIDDIETREDGGTPAFLATIKTALAIRLKEEMGSVNIRKREAELLNLAWDRLTSINNLHVLAENTPERLAIFSFFIDDLHYNLAVRMLNDRYGIQVRGGCACAGTYGHYLLYINSRKSHDIANKILAGDFTERPGWVRLSLHPTQSNAEIEYILSSIEALASNYQVWKSDYICDFSKMSIRHKQEATPMSKSMVERIFHT
jgi:selenocysteine lyase/cysteine desulfurase